MTRSRVLPLLALAAGLVLAAGGTAQPPKVVIPGPPGTGPGVGAEIPMVPKSAAAFVSVKVSDVVDHPDLKAALEQLKKTPEATDGFTEMLGVLPHEIERVTLFWPALTSRGPGAPVVVVTTRQPYNEVRLLKALRAEPVYDGDFGGGARWGPGAGEKPSAGAIKNEPPATAPDIRPDPPPAAVQKKEVPDKKDPPEFEDPCSATVAAAPGEPLFFALARGGPFSLLFLIDDRTLVFLADDFDRGFSHLTLLAQLLQKKTTGPLAEAIATGGNHTLTAGVYLSPLFREFDRRMPPELAPYAALFASRTVVVTGDLTKTANLTLKLTFDDAAAARRAGPVLEEGLKALAEKAGEAAAELKNARRPSEKALAPLVEAAAAGLKNATVKAEGSAVVATGELDVGPAAARAAAGFLQSLSSRRKFAERSNHLKQIGIALHNYHDVHGKFPANVYGPKGEVLLSWRVQLLPFLEEDNLYKQFKLDEPWDSPNNKPLIDRMPRVFEVPGREAHKGKTFFQGFTSPDPRKAKQPPGGFAGSTWLTEGHPNGIRITGIVDGTSNTIAVAEARDAVIWSKPDDLPFGEKLPALGEEKADEFMVLMFDGSVRELPTRIRPETLRALITTNGGEVVDIDADEDRPRFPRGPGGAGIKPGASVPPKTAADPKPPPPQERPEQRRRKVEAVEAVLEAARADLVQQQAETAAQRDRTKRVIEMFAQGAATKKEVEEARHDLEIAEARLGELATRVRLQREQLEEARRPPAKEAPPEKK